MRSHTVLFALVSCCLTREILSFDFKSPTIVIGRSPSQFNSFSQLSLYSTQAITPTLISSKRRFDWISSISATLNDFSSTTSTVTATTSDDDIQESDLVREVGFLPKNSKNLPEKRGFKKSRDQDRIRIRFERQAQRADESRQQFLMGKQEKNMNYQNQESSSLHDSKQFNNNNNNNKKRNNDEKDHTCMIYEIAKLLKASKSEREMNQILRNAKLSPRDESDLVRILGSRCAYDPMLFLLYNSPNGPNVHSYTSAIASLAHSSSPDYRKQALKVLDSMSNKGVIPNSFTFTAAFLAVDGAAQAIEMMKKIDILSEEIDSRNNNLHNVFTFNSAIHSCSRGNSPNGFKTARQFYESMNEKNIAPNEKTLTSLLHCATKSISYTNKQIEKQSIFHSAMSLLDDMRLHKNIVPSPKAWGAALSVCAAAGADEKAKEIFDTMGEVGCTKNIIHYNQYLSALAKAGKDDLVWRVFEGMQKDSNVLPEIVTLNTVLGAFARSGNYTQASRLLSRMKEGEFEFREARNGREYVPLRGHSIENKLFPDTISYNSVLSACSDSKEALCLVNEMRMSRRRRSNLIAPTSVTYTNAITACRKSNPPDLEAAKRLFEIATKSDAIIPNVYIYSALIWTAERSKDANEALQIFYDMKSRKCKPNVVSYDGVISALTNKVVDGEGDSHILLESLETATKLFEEMKKSGVTPTTVTYQKLALAINSYYAHTNVSESDKLNAKIALLERISSKMSKNERRLKLGGTILKSLIMTYGNLRMYDDAKRVYEFIVGEVDKQTTSAILFACSRADPAKWEEAIGFVKQQAERKNKRYVNPMLLNYAVIACSKENKWEEGLDLIEDYYELPATRSEESERFSDSFLSVSALNSLTSACGRCGRPDVAVTILNDMASKYGVKPDERSYRSAIIACNQAEHEIQRYKEVYKEEEEDDGDELQWWECSLSLFRRMQEENLLPDVQTYSSVISACQAAGQWQRAIGVLQSMIKQIEEHNLSSPDSTSSLNLFCFNAAIAACEKGGAWVEALSLYENLKSSDKVQPNFVTVNCVIIALDHAGQKELAESIYKDALKEGIVSPWKYRYVDEEMNENSKRIRVLDFHQFSVSMAKIAVINVMESLLQANPVHDRDNDLIIIVGKGKGSDEWKGPVLSPVIINLFKSDYGVDAHLEEHNSGRLRITSDSLHEYTSERAWRSWHEQEEDSI